MKNHLLSVIDLSLSKITSLVKQAGLVKKKPKLYKKKLDGKTLLTFFELPSLRTAVSFQVGMKQLGGNVMEYQAVNSPWGKGKESIEDVSRVLSRYVDCVMMRIKNHDSLIKFAYNSSVPVINGLTSQEHPCQVLSDLFSLKERFGKLKGLKICYYGDANNNVTHSLMLLCSAVGIDMTICCPSSKKYSPATDVLERARNGKSKITVTSDPRKGSIGAHVVYTDSWMSYHIAPSQQKARVKALSKYQVNAKVMKSALKNAVFMHCLPAKKGYEVSEEVFESSQSIVFDQAENRMHMQKAILMNLLR